MSHATARNQATTRNGLETDRDVLCFTHARKVPGFTRPRRRWCCIVPALNSPTWGGHSAGQRGYGRRTGAGCSGVRRWRPRLASGLRGSCGRRHLPRPLWRVGTGTQGTRPLARPGRGRGEKPSCLLPARACLALGALYRATSHRAPPGGPAGSGDAQSSVAWKVAHMATPSSETFDHAWQTGFSNPLTTRSSQCATTTAKSPTCLSGSGIWGHGTYLVPRSHPPVLCWLRRSSLQTP